MLQLIQFFQVQISKQLIGSVLASMGMVQAKVVVTTKCTLHCKGGVVAVSNFMQSFTSAAARSFYDGWASVLRTQSLSARDKRAGLRDVVTNTFEHGSRSACTACGKADASARIAEYGFSGPWQRGHPCRSVFYLTGEIVTARISGAMCMCCHGAQYRTCGMSV